MTTTTALFRATAVLVGLSWHGSLPAAAFQNLDFESARTPLVANDPLGYGRVPITDALPGWRGYVGTNAQALVLNNLAFLSSAGVGLAGPGEWHGALFPRNIIGGSYSAFLQTGPDVAQGPPLTFYSSLGQVGLVPLSAMSLQLRIDAYGPFSVSLGGQPLALVPLQTAPGSTLYGADISSFAGQTTDLRITSDVWLGPAGLSHLWLDSIVFSPVAVPEPSVFGFVLVGAAALWVRRSYSKRLPR